MGIVECDNQPKQAATMAKRNERRKNAREGERDAKMRVYDCD
jgi:hypothetical protein